MRAELTNPTSLCATRLTEHHLTVASHLASSYGANLLEQDWSSTFTPASRTTTAPLCHYWQPKTRKKSKRSKPVQPIRIQRRSKYPYGLPTTHPLAQQHSKPQYMERTCETRRRTTPDGPAADLAGSEKFVGGGAEAKRRYQSGLPISPMRTAALQV